MTQDVVRFEDLPIGADFKFYPAPEYGIYCKVSLTRYRLTGGASPWYPVTSLTTEVVPYTED